MKIKMFLAGAGLMLAMTANVSAQTMQHDSIHVKIMKNENGVLTDIDTTVAAAQHDQLVLWLSSQGIELPPPPPPGMPGDSLHRKMVMVFDIDDSLPPGQFPKMAFAGMPGDSVRVMDIRIDSVLPEGARLMPPPGMKAMHMPSPPPGHEGDMIIIMNDSAGGKHECRKTVVINNMPPPPPPAPGANAKGKTPPPPKNEMLIYPNPSKGHFTIDINMPGKEKAEMEVIDANGKTVYSEEIPNSDGKISKEIDLSKNGKGIYSVRVSKGGKVIVEQVVVE
jgi:hypothetical protein